MEQPENTYSQVIFKQDNDQQAQELVNSYRFKSPSHSRYKMWTPEIQNEEIARRKRHREDKYIHQFDANERPILVIQNKEDFQNKTLPVVQNNQEGDQYYKVSENTQEIEDPQAQILGQTNLIRKQTRVHTTKNQAQNDQNAHLYKIEGIEFLPQGFLELDPLLYHDEFAFENKLHKDIFSKEQRRLKAIRRKQYEMRNQHKMRNVTLYIEDEKTEKVIQFLEKWYFKKRRKMNQEELEHASKELDIDVQAMSDLQENYLHYKKIQNTKDLQNYLNVKGKIQGDNINIPDNLSKYFVKNEHNNSTMKSNGSKNNLNGSLNESMRKKKKGQKSKQNVKLSEVNFEPENSQQFQQIRSSLKNDESVQGYFDNEISKILLKIQDSNNNKNQYSNYQNLNQKNQNLNKSQDYNNVVDQEAIDEIIAQIMYSKQGDNQFERSPQQLYQDMMKQKISKNPKFTKPKTIGSQSKPLSRSQNVKSKGKSKRNKQSQIGLDKKSINLKYQTTDGQYHLIQKLEPLQIGNQYYFMSIEEHIPLSGSPSINLVTRDEQGVVVSSKPIEMDNLGKFYQTKVYLQPQNLTNDNQFVVVVENDKGNTLLTQKIREKLPSFINENSNPQHRATVINPSGTLKDQNRRNTVHVLQSVNIGEQFYQQVVKELIDENGWKQLQIVTHDEKGSVYAQQLVQGNFGDQFSTVIAEDFINQNKEREFSILTMDNKGNEITRHFGTQAYRDKSDINILQEIKRGRISQVQFEGKVIQVYSIPIAFSGQTIFKQKLYEKIDENGQRQRYLVTFNENGEIVGKDSIDPELLGKKYYSQIMKEYYQNGVPHVLLATKNDRQEVVNMKEISIYNNNDGNKLIKDFKKHCKGQTSYNQTNSRKSIVGGKNILLQPVIYKKQFFQQNIQESGVGQQPKTKLITCDEQKNVLSTHIIAEEQYKGKIFQTKIAQIEGTNQISLITLNEKGEIVYEQELEDKYDEILNDRYVEEFDKKSRGKNVIVSKKNLPNHKVSRYEVRPANIEENTFQQVVIDLEDEFKETERMMYTRDQYGQILEAESIKTDVLLDDNMVQKFMESKDTANSTLICLFNQEDEEVGKQHVSFIPQSEYRRRQVQKFDNTIRHTLNLDQCGIDHYQQIVEEILEGGQVKLRIKNVMDGQEIQVKEVQTKLIGNQYHSKVTSSFINNEGKRQTTVQVLNDKNQVLGQFDLENQEEDEKFEHDTTFDGKTVQQLKKNTIQVSNSKNGKKTTLKRLRPTQVGKKTYDCYFEEVVGNDGSKRLTLIMKDDVQNEVAKQEVESNFMADNYECYLDSQLNDIEQGKNFVFRNSKNRLLKVKDLLKNEEEKEFVQKNNFDKIEEIFDDLGRKQSTIYAQKTPRQTIMSHRLKPTLIGSQHYQVTINEILEGGQKVRSTLLISDEQGKLVTSKELPLDQGVENYYSEIVNELMTNNKQRRVTLILKDQNNREVAQVDLSPEIQSYYYDLKSNVIEEILDQDGKKKISIFYKDKLNHVLQTIEEENESENDNQMSHQEKVKHFEKLLKIHGGKIKSNRYSLNPSSQTIRSKAQTINVLQKDDLTQFQSFGKNQAQNLNNTEQLEVNDILNQLDRKQTTHTTPRRSSMSPQTIEQLSKLRKSTTGEIDEAELKRQVSMLVNEEKDKMIYELMNELIQEEGTIPEDEIEAFLRYCREELIYDQSYKDQILMVSLFYYFLKKKQGWKLN